MKVLPSFFEDDGLANVVLVVHSAPVKRRMKQSYNRITSIKMSWSIKYFDLTVSQLLSADCQCLVHFGCGTSPERHRATAAATAATSAYDWWVQFPFVFLVPNFSFVCRKQVWCQINFIQVTGFIESSLCFTGNIRFHCDRPGSLCFQVGFWCWI